MGTTMFVYQTSTRGHSITLLHEHAQFEYRYCSPLTDRTRFLYTRRYCPNEGQSGNETASSVDSSLCSLKNILMVNT